MMRWKTTRTAFALALATTGVSRVDAATIAFSGTRMSLDAPGPAAARCGALSTANIRNNPPMATSSGLSNLGAFVPTLSHCIQLPLSLTDPTPFTLGEFLFEFAAGDTLIGTQSGSITPNSPGLFDIAQAFVVTGGTGRFAGASGSFTSVGTLNFRFGQPRTEHNFSGLLKAPAIPEPASWATMLLGFGIIGMALRSRPKPTVTVMGFGRQAS